MAGGCATTPPSVDASTSTFAAPGFRIQGTIAVLPADSALQSSLEFQYFRKQIEEKLVAAGYALAPVESAGQVALVSYGVDNGKTQTYSTPIYGQTGGGVGYTSGTFRTATGYSSYTGTSYTMPTFGVVGTQVDTLRLYVRVFAMDVLDGNSFRTNSPEKLLELRTRSEGTCGVIASSMPYVIQSAFMNFPGVSGSAQTTHIPLPPDFHC